MKRSIAWIVGLSVLALVSGCGDNSDGEPSGMAGAAAPPAPQGGSQSTDAGRIDSGTSSGSAGSTAGAGGAGTDAGGTPTGGTPGTDSGAPPPVLEGIPCVNSGECAPPVPYCHDAANVCVECLADPNCGSVATPACDVETGACVECNEDAHCGGVAVCNTATNRCVECVDDSSCSADPYCNTATNRCVACLSDVNCGGSGLFCFSASGSCEPGCGSGGACDPVFETCDGTSCLCSAGTTDCGGECVDTDTDPRNCGGCPGQGLECADEEICDGGSCACRPGLTLCDGICVDTESNPDHCGDCAGNVCLSGEQCQGGSCAPTSEGCDQDSCLVGSDRNACVAFFVDPLNCGACNQRCDREQLCVDGNCRKYLPAATCSSCPCDDQCGRLVDTPICCDGSSGSPICVENGACP